MAQWEVIEKVSGRTDRLAIPGGHLYRTRYTEGIAMVFVPTPSDSISADAVTNAATIGSFQTAPTDTLA
jgi:hypothetical protein